LTSIAVEERKKYVYYYYILYVAATAAYFLHCEIVHSQHEIYESQSKML